MTDYTHFDLVEIGAALEQRKSPLPAFEKGSEQKTQASVFRSAWII